MISIYIFLHTNLNTLSSPPFPFPTTGFIFDRISGYLLPDEVELVPTCLWRSRRLGIGIRNVNEMLNWYFFERNNRSLLRELVSEVQHEEDWDVDV